MTSSTRAFWWSGVIGIGLAELLGQLGGLSCVPCVNQWVRTGGAAGMIATLVLGVTVWVLLVLLAITRQVARERRLTRYALLLVGGDSTPSELGPPTDVDKLLDHPDLA